MEEKIESLRKNQTWTLVDLPRNYKVVRCKYVFSVVIKFMEDLVCAH